MKVLLVGLLNIGLLDGLLGVAGGCWDDDITSDGLDRIIPENSLLSTSKKL